MWLRCRTCPDAKFFVAKYYPSQGWYINREEDGLQAFGDDLNQWLDEHKHGTMWGSEIYLEKEQETEW